MEKNWCIVSININDMRTKEQEREHHHNWYLKNRVEYNLKRKKKGVRSYKIREVEGNEKYSFYRDNYIRSCF